MNTEPIRHILVPTDFSSGAEHALEAAISISLAHGARITIMHTISPIPEIYLLQKDKSTIEQHEQLLRQKSQKITELATHIKSTKGVMVDSRIVIGQTVASICAAAIDFGTGLIVMATHGISGFREFLIGSNTYSVIEKSDCPVLSIPEKSTNFEFDKVMFPVRNIPNALAKYGFMKRILKTRNTSITIFGVDLAVEDKELDVRSQLEDFDKKVRDDGFYTELIYHHSQDNAATDVLTAATEMNSNLIVVTSKIKTSFQDFFLGKFAEQIVNPFVSSSPTYQVK